MKKMVFAIAIASVGLMSFTYGTTPENVATSVEEAGSTFKLVNDTGSKVKISHRNGSVSLNNGGSTSLSCTSGNDISADGDVVFTVSSDLCGKTIKLSKYM